MTRIVASWCGPFLPDDVQLATIYARLAFVGDKDGAKDVRYTPLLANPDFTWMCAAIESIP